MTDFLKDYKIISNIPYSMYLMDLSTKELRVFKNWFFEIKESRLIELQNAYHAFCGKDLDYSPESLKGLSKFFVKSIDFQKLPQDVYEILRARVPLDIPIDDYDFTKRSKSLIVDVGIYLGEVMIRNHKNMCWEQYLPRMKRAYLRGYMVIEIKKKFVFNPIRITDVLGSKVADNTFKKYGLYDIYIYYCEEVSSEYL